ncbi:hypothetical protein ACFL1S_02320 [Pseudomonadota bacterium]
MMSSPLDLRNEVSQDKDLCIVDGDLTELIGALGLKVVEVKVVSPFVSQSNPRAVYKIRLENGEFFKARIFSNPQSAERVHKLSSYLADLNISRSIGLLGKAVLFDWVDGFHVPLECMDRKILTASGVLFAQIHAPRIHPEFAGKYGYRGMEILSAVRIKKSKDVLTKNRIKEIRSLGLLTPPEADVLTDLLLDLRLDDHEVSIIATDFCPENLVVTKFGEVYLIDTEGLVVHSLGFDFARLLYRWPMTQSQRRIFMEGYASLSGRKPPPVDLRYWLLTILVESVMYRHAHPYLDEERPLELLRCCASLGREFLNCDLCDFTGGRLCS